MKACESNPNQFMHDCCEKAKKFDEIKDGTLGFIRAFNWLDKNKSIFLPTPNTPEPETPQPRKNQKLRELIERYISDLEANCGVTTDSAKQQERINVWSNELEELQKLLKESKK